MKSTLTLPKLPLTCPPPHFNHHVLCCLGLLTVTERDVETSGRLHVFHQDLHHLSFMESGWLFQSLTLQGIQGRGRTAEHLQVHEFQTYSAITQLVLRHAAREYVSAADQNRHLLWLDIDTLQHLILVSKCNSHILSPFLLAFPKRLPTAKVVARGRLFHFRTLGLLQVYKISQKKKKERKTQNKSNKFKATLISQ